MKDRPVAEASHCTAHTKHKTKTSTTLAEFQPTIPASEQPEAYASDCTVTQFFVSVNMTETMYITCCLAMRPVHASDDIRINTQYRWMYYCWEKPDVVGRIIFQCHFIHRKFRTYWNQIRASAVKGRRLSSQIIQRPEHTPTFYPHLLPDHPPYQETNDPLLFSLQLSCFCVINEERTPVRTFQFLSLLIFLGSDYGIL